jgi:hypothetical protein
VRRASLFREVARHWSNLQKKRLFPVKENSFLIKSLTGEKREQFVILHSEYEFLGPRRYVSLNLSLPLDNARIGSSSDKGDYGFKFALIALYYLHCRDNPHIQSFIDGKGKEYVPKRSKPQRKTPPRDWDEDPFLSMVFGEPETLDEQLYPAVPPNYAYDALYFDDLLPLPSEGPNYNESYFDNLPPVPPDEPDSEI